MQAQMDNIKKCPLVIICIYYYFSPNNLLFKDTGISQVCPAITFHLLIAILQLLIKIILLFIYYQCFVLFLLAIVLSVLRFSTSDWPFGIFMHFCKVTVKHFLFTGSNLRSDCVWKHQVTGSFLPCESAI